LFRRRLLWESRSKRRLLWLNRSKLTTFVIKSPILGVTPNRNLTSVVIFP
jgi:hypothetical protein